MSMLRWMCEFNVKDKKYGGYEIIVTHVVIIKKSRLQWFGRVECRDDADWLKQFMTMEIEGTWPRVCLRKTWWDCVKGDMSFWPVL